MPELPEVETTLRGVAPHIVDQVIGPIKDLQRVIALARDSGASLS